MEENRKLQICRILDWVAISACIGIALQVLFFAIIAFKGSMDTACDICIWALRDWEKHSDWSYEAINVVLFIFLEPLAIGFNVLLYFFHKYTFSHVLMAINNIAALLLIFVVCSPIYFDIFYGLFSSL